MIAESAEGRGWDSSWSHLGRDMVQLFTRGTPKTIHQLWHRCYFEDLWAFMGDDARTARYVELGAGRGTSSMYLADRNCNVTMVDLSGEGFKVARRNFTASGVPMPAMVIADAERTGFEPESFDCIYSIGLLEHFEDPRQVLAESYSLLAPGGRNFAVVIPDRPHCRWLTNAIFQPWTLAWALMPEVLKRWIRRGRGAPGGQPVIRTKLGAPEYMRILRDLGADEIHCIPYNSLHPVFGPGWLERALVLPLYRLLIGVKRALGRKPLLRTHASLASCELLTFRKGR